MFKIHQVLYEPVCLYLQPGLGQEEDSETICHEDYDQKFPFCNNKSLTNNFRLYSRRSPKRSLPTTEC
jgi:hypothetical protein